MDGKGCGVHILKTALLFQLNKMNVFHFVCVNSQRAFRDVLAPVRFFTPFPRQSFRPCGTPRVYQLSCTDIHQPYLSPPDVYYRAHTVLGPNSVGFPRDRLGKAKSSDVASSIPECSSELFKLSLTRTKWKRSNKIWGMSPIDKPTVFL